MPILIAYLIVFYVVHSSICYSEEENIVDDYGNLRTKEILAIENSLKSAMKEKRTNFYFINVYEDINNNYANSFPDISVIIYYNNNTYKLNTVSNLDDLNSKDLSVNLDNPDELQYEFSEYIQYVSNNVQKKETIQYYDSSDEKFEAFLICIFGLPITTFFFINCICTIKKELELIKIAKALE